MTSEQPPPQPEPNFQGKLTDALIKLLITGSGGSALYFVYVDQLPKAAIAGIVALGAGLLTSLGEGLMKPLQEGMSKRGERLGKAADEAIAKTVDRPLETLGFQKNYLEALKAYCYKVEIEGFQDLPGLALEDVFIPLRIESTENRLTVTGSREIWEFLPKRHQNVPKAYSHRRIVILAGPGYGKTTLLRHLTFVFASNGCPAFVQMLLPVLLRFREVHTLIEDSLSPDLPDLVAQHLKHQAEFKTLEPKPSPEWFRDRLSSGQCLVMLDGLDEVPKSQRPKVRQWVDGQMKAYRQTQFILTSRPHGFELDPDDPETVPVEIDCKLRVLDFNPDQKQQFIEKWYRTIIRREWESLLQENLQKPEGSRLSREQVQTQIEQETQKNTSELIRQIVNSPSLNDLAKNPLLMTMITTTHRIETELPQRRVELYDKICSLLLGTRPRSKKTPLTLTATGNRAVLQVLAWNLVQQEKTQFTPEQGTEWIQTTLDRCCKNRSLTPDQFWEEMTEISGLLVEQEIGKYEFAHQTFQEYFSALQLREMGQAGEAILLEKLTNDRWEEVICLYGAMGDASNLINKAIDLGINSSSSYIYTLMKRLEEESREVDQSVRERIRGSIRDFLAVAVKLGEIATLSKGTVEPQLSDELITRIRLENRFAKLVVLNEATAIDVGYITWREYQLFLEDQKNGQFHSKASLIAIPPKQEDQPALGIAWEDARWFCAWLATKSDLQPEEGTYDFRLPTIEERPYAPLTAQWNLETGELLNHFPFTNPPDSRGNTLQIVRVKLPDRYKALVNFLANGRWKEADDETAYLLLEMGAHPDHGYFRRGEVNNIPCDDLQVIDQLWVKFSGGHFGLSVQKQIFTDLGGQPSGEYDKAPYDQLMERLGWSLNGQETDYSGLSFSLQSPQGHLPRLWGIIYIGFGGRPGITSWAELFAHLESCGL